jgi:putative membrane protein
MSLKDLPTLNALLNAGATVLITAGLLNIRAGRKSAHRACMLAALVASCLFLAGYLTHKYLLGAAHTPFGGTGAVRGVYYAMLASHVVLAMVIVPLVLWTFSLAWRGSFERHRRWARWTMPLWLYVSLTGVLVYLCLYVWYPARPL